VDGGGAHDDEHNEAAGDHGRRAASRALDKGAMGMLMVAGDARPDIFRSLSSEIAKRPSGH
jgi:hypothetical protein